jgi:DNA-binding transcriptional regulator YhcF (GntR family)
MTNGGVSRNQGGAFGADNLQKARDEENFRKQKEAERENYNRRLDELIDEYESRGYSFEQALKIAKEFLRMGGWSY